MFGPDGAPLHPLVSYLGLGDLAAAAVRADRRIEGHSLLDNALDHLSGPPSPRLEQILARARGLFAGPAQAGAHFEKALSDPAGERWPCERAQLQLDYAEWLRRRRRINDAKPLLLAAHDTFQGLQAKPLTQRAEAELRACGVRISALPSDPGGMAGLTPQQREIIVLAGSGLTNREIADPAVPVPPHGGVAPLSLLSQTRHIRAPPAPRPHRPGRHSAPDQDTGVSLSPTKWLYSVARRLHPLARSAP
jgi:hypothetical protein